MAGIQFNEGQAERLAEIMRALDGIAHDFAADPKEAEQVETVRAGLEAHLGRPVTFAETIRVLCTAGYLALKGGKA